MQKLQQRLYQWAQLSASGGMDRDELLRRELAIQFEIRSVVDKRAELDDVLEKLKRALVTPEMVKEWYGNVDALLEPSTTSTARESEPAVPKANGS